MPDLETIQNYIDERGSPALMLPNLDQAIVGAGELGPDNEYILIYSVQRVIQLLQALGSDFDDAVKHFEEKIKAQNNGAGTPIFIDEVTK